MTARRTIERRNESVPARAVEREDSLFRAFFGVVGVRSSHLLPLSDSYLFLTLTAKTRRQRAQNAPQYSEFSFALNGFHSSAGFGPQLWKTAAIRFSHNPCVFVKV